MKKKLVVFTGSGISAESGIPTFRDSVKGLWENFNVDEVCTAGCLKKDPEKVHEFYNTLRDKYSKCEPNEAHKVLAELEKDYDVTIITQNVDDLHERAGSSDVIHLHGEMMKCRDSGNTNYIFDIPEDENGNRHTYPGMKIDGHPIRPHVVFFGEDVPNMDRAIYAVRDAEIFVIIGTSLVVYPAASLTEYVDDKVPVYYIDPYPKPNPYIQNLTMITKPATKGILELKELLKQE